MEGDAVLNCKLPFKQHATIESTSLAFLCENIGVSLHGEAKLESGVTAHALFFEVPVLSLSTGNSSNRAFLRKIEVDTNRLWDPGTRTFSPWPGLCRSTFAYPAMYTNWGVGTSETLKIAQCLCEEVKRVRTQRPRARRYEFAATIELTDLQTGEQRKERMINLSLYGCRVVTCMPFSTGAKTRIRITRMGETLTALGTVAHTTESGEMGIAFTKIELRDQLILEKWVEELRSALR
jgi:hypothetical protein